MEELRARYKVYVKEIELELRSVGFCGGVEESGRTQK